MPSFSRKKSYLKSFSILLSNIIKFSKNTSDIFFLLYIQIACEDFLDNFLQHIKYGGKDVAKQSYVITVQHLNDTLELFTKY